MIGPSLAASARGVPRLRWGVIAWMFVISAVSYLDRNNLSIAAASIKAAYDLSDSQLGLLFSAFVFGYALSQPIAGRIADRFGPHRVVAIAIVWWSVFTASTALVPTGTPHSLMLLMLIRCLLGIGESVIFPAGNRLVSSWIPVRERGLANGLIFAGVGVGGGIAPPLITWIIVSYGWQAAFHASAAIGIVVGVVWLVLVRDRPDQHPRISPEEQAFIAAGIPATPASARDGPPIGWRQVVRDRQLQILTASYFCFGYVAYIFFSWFFLYLSSVRGLDLKSSAVLAMLPFLAMTIFSTLGGAVSDRLAARYGAQVGRCRVAAVSMLLAAVFVVAATQVADARLASLVLAGGAGSLYFAQSAYWTLSAGMGGRASGLVSGIMNMGAQVGGIVVAALTPVVAAALGWSASFMLAGILALVGGLAWLAIDADHRLDFAE